MIKNLKIKNGFAIIELVIYLGLLALLVSLAMTSLVTTSTNYQKDLQTNRTLDDLIFLDHKITAAIDHNQSFQIEQIDNIIYWQIGTAPQEPIMVAPPNSLSIKKIPSDLGTGELLEVSITVNYLPLTIYHYLP